MTVKQLIEKLKDCPQDLVVMMYYDGAARTMCDGAFEQKNLEVFLNGDDDYTKAITDVLVLCETEDVYDMPKDSVWYFKDEK
jgi:hypothetical protein